MAVMPLPLEVRWWRRKDEAKTLVTVSALCWVLWLHWLRDRKAISPKNLCHLSQRFSPGTSVGRRPRENQLTQICLENGH